MLQKNELKYFKDSSRKDPVRVLDLDECKECVMEGEFKGKEHVFRYFVSVEKIFNICLKRNVRFVLRHRHECQSVVCNILVSSHPK